MTAREFCVGGAGAGGGTGRRCGGGGETDWRARSWAWISIICSRFLRAIAAISALVAFVVTTYFKEHTVAKAISIIFAVMTTMGAISASFYDRHQTIVAREAEAQRVRDEAPAAQGNRDELPRSSQRGTTQGSLRHVSAPIPNQAVEKLGQSARGFRPVKTRRGICFEDEERGEPDADSHDSE